LRSRINITDPNTNPEGVYVPPAFGRDGRRATIAPRYSNDHHEETPSPDQYNPHRELGVEARKAAFHGPTDRGPDNLGARSPGPAEYSATDPATYKERSPRFTLKGAKYDAELDPSGAYRDLGSTLEKPKTTIHIRPTLDPSYG
jgi:hypothetical protein